jgi:hypothetical protein
MYRAYKIGDCYLVRDTMNLNNIRQELDISITYPYTKDSYNSFRLALKL